MQRMCVHSVLLSGMNHHGARAINSIDTVILVISLTAFLVVVALKLHQLI